MSLTVKTDDVTKGRKDVDPHGRFRGEWVKVIILLVRSRVRSVSLQITQKVLLGTDNPEYYKKATKLYCWPAVL